MNGLGDVAEFFADPVRQTASLSERAHRPWPLPHRPWLMGQTWRHLLFAHWPLPAAALRALVPASLDLHLFEGRAWIGCTPFLLSGLRLALTPPLPRLSSFPELNVRTYVTVNGRAGIYFFSLDAASRVAVELARRTYRLPYFVADMTSRRHAGTTEYSSERVDGRGDQAAFRACYRPVGSPAIAQSGSLEHFLVERYCLYTIGGDGEPLRGDIHHPAWRLQPAEAEIELNTMAPPGLALPPTDPILHYAARQDVLVWPLRPAA